jgi:hypothetical protein
MSDRSQWPVPEPPGTGQEPVRDRPRPPRLETTMEHRVARFVETRR